MCVRVSITEKQCCKGIGVTDPFFARYFFPGKRCPGASNFLPLYHNTFLPFCQYGILHKFLGPLGLHNKLTIIACAHEGMSAREGHLYVRDGQAVHEGWTYVHVAATKTSCSCAPDVDICMPAANSCCPPGKDKCL